MLALLAASSLRVDVAGLPAVDGLALATTGERVLVLGAARALFEAAAGLRPVARGEIAVEGRPPIEAVRARLAAGAPLDPPMPPRWTVLQYVTWSARLAGHAPDDAEALAAEAIDRAQLSSSSATRLRAASPPMRRAAVIAAARATGAGALLVDDPLSGLAAEVAQPLARIVARMLSDRRSVVFAGRVSLDSPIALAADEAVVVDGAHVAAQGAPAEVAAADRTFSLRVSGAVGDFVTAIAAEGGRAIAAPDAPPPVHVRVELGPLSARDLLRIAESAHAVVLELRPIARAIA